MPIIYEPKGRAREYALWAVNIYSGCVHGCRYCFAPAAIRRERSDFHQNVMPRKNIKEQLQNEAEKLSSTNKGAKILLSFTTDPYQPIEEHLCITRDAIQTIHKAGLFVSILTKGGSIARRDFDILNKNDSFGTTLTFTDKEDSEYWEPHAASPADRIETIKLAHEMGIKTWVSLEPVIDPKQTLELISETYTFVDFYKVGCLNHSELAKKIDWKQFGHDAEKLLIALGNEYYIKKDLREKM